MTDTEKVVTWGLLGLIAWELWQQVKPGTTTTGIDTVGDNIPAWIKQLSRNNSKIDYFRRIC